MSIIRSNALGLTVTLQQAPRRGEDDVPGAASLQLKQSLAEQLSPRSVDLVMSLTASSQHATLMVHDVANGTLLLRKLAQWCRTELPFQLVQQTPRMLHMIPRLTARAGWWTSVLNLMQVCTGGLNHADIGWYVLLGGSSDDVLQTPSPILMAGLVGRCTVMGAAGYVVQAEYGLDMTQRSQSVLQQRPTLPASTPAAASSSALNDQLFGRPFLQRRLLMQWAEPPHVPARWAMLSHNDAPSPMQTLDARAVSAPFEWRMDQDVWGMHPACGFLRSDGAHVTVEAQLGLGLSLQQIEQDQHDHEWRHHLNWWRQWLRMNWQDRCLAWHRATSPRKQSLNFAPQQSSFNFAATLSPAQIIRQWLSDDVSMRAALPAPLTPHHTASVWTDLSASPQYFIYWNSMDQLLIQELSQSQLTGAQQRATHTTQLMTLNDMQQWQAYIPAKPRTRTEGLAAIANDQQPPSHAADVKPKMVMMAGAGTWPYVLADKWSDMADIVLRSDQLSMEQLMQEAAQLVVHIHRLPSDVPKDWLTRVKQLEQQGTPQLILGAGCLSYLNLSIDELEVMEAWRTTSAWWHRHKLNAHATSTKPSLVKLLVPLPIQLPAVVQQKAVTLVDDVQGSPLIIRPHITTVCALPWPHAWKTELNTGVDDAMSASDESAHAMWQQLIQSLLLPIRRDEPSLTRAMPFVASVA